jgi:hypothetical protein
VAIVLPRRKKSCSPTALTPYGQRVDDVEIPVTVVVAVHVK